jgi:hypothetical protein
MRNNKNRQIYHQKWSFVKDSYSGFDVKAHKEWSHYWETHPDIANPDIANSLVSIYPDWRSRIGYLSFWKEHVLSRVLKSQRKKSIRKKPTMKRKK